MTDHDESPTKDKRGRQGQRGVSKQQCNPCDNVGISTSSTPKSQDGPLDAFGQDVGEDSDDVLLGIGYAGREARNKIQKRRVVVCEGAEDIATDEQTPAQHFDEDQDEEQGIVGVDMEEEEEEWQVCAGEAWEEGDILIEEAGHADLLHSRWLPFSALCNVMHFFIRKFFESS